MPEIIKMIEAALTNLPARPVPCDHCGVVFSGRPKRTGVPGDSRGYEVVGIRCASCGKDMFYLAEWEDSSSMLPMRPKSITRLWPQRAYVHVPNEVPEEIALEFREASAVFPASPKASAALSRRLLQRLLHESGIDKKNLRAEIDEYLKTSPPSYIADALHAVRHVGNFAAHPEKSTRTGEVIDVEPGEAEWLLETIAGLFDHMFVHPTLAKERQARLAQKLEEAGKAPTQVPSRRSGPSLRKSPATPSR
jgi:hypothetical protein